MTRPDPVIEATRNHRASHGRRILNEFREFLGMPNVSKDLDDVASVAQHIVAMLAARGVAARTVKRPDAAPLVVGRVVVPGATRTVGFYAHYDGQPIDQDDWNTDPFTPTLTTGPSNDPANAIAWSAIEEVIDDDWRIYARSSSDDKAPVLAMCHALEALASAGLDPSANLVFLFEGEEEIGSPHLAAYLNDLRDELGDVDTWLICDGPVHQTGAAQVVFGVRGISEMEITVYGPTRPLHSGHYGNWVRNPNMELSRLLASMKDAAGNVVIDGFYGDTVAITAEDGIAIAALPDDDSALRRSLGTGEHGGGQRPLGRTPPVAVAERSGVIRWGRRVRFRQCHTDAIHGFDRHSPRPRKRPGNDHGSGGRPHRGAGMACRHRRARHANTVGSRAHRQGDTPGFIPRGSHPAELSPVRSCACRSRAGGFRRCSRRPQLRRVGTASLLHHNPQRSGGDHSIRQPRQQPARRKREHPHRQPLVRNRPHGSSDDDR